MRKNATFRVSGANFKELEDSFRAKYKSLYGDDLGEIPHDVEFDIEEDQATDPGESPRFRAKVVIHQIEKPRGSSGT